MKLTMSSEMGIHAVWFLATLNVEEPVLSSAVAEGISVSESYLIKVLKRLVAARVLTSRKGKRGGYMLKQRPEQITLADIVRACEGPGGLYSCLSEERGCTEQQPHCPVCHTLRRAEEAMFDELRRTRISDLLAFGWASPIPESAPRRGGREV
jgi:Rrf2 family protein